jgi:cobalt-zinc-cadmium efflux system outer membrane protein
LNLKIFILYLVLYLLAGCTAHSPHNQDYISDSILDREGFNLPQDTKVDTFDFAHYFKLGNGLTEEKAIALALWNNPQFQADLTLLGFIKADLIEAGMLKNPVFSLLFPIGPKQLEFALNIPVEFFWQRPYRVAQAKLNAEKVAESLVQNGLGLIRNVRISLADYYLAQEKTRIVTDEAALQTEILRVAAVRFKVGDISELEETAFRLLAAQTREKAIQFARDARREEIQLKGMLRINSDTFTIDYHPLAPDSLDVADSDTLLSRALAARPDLRAAEITIEAAGEKLGLEKSKIVNLTAVIDANAQGKEGFEIGPGLQIELPLFNRNEAGRERAKAEINQAAWNYLVVKQKIITGLLQAHNDYLAAQQIFNLYRKTIIPGAGAAAQNAEKAYTLGDISYIEFLEFKRQLLNAQLHAAEIEAEVRKSIANLQFSVGSQFIYNGDKNTINGK